ncbi:MAG: glycosyltransferase, partial [Acidobacteriota bacterium]|nr:glycosyltransferase [Acidobacteriota bacterium]
KGASVHIAKFAQTLFQAANGGLLYTLGGGELPSYQREGAIEIVRFASNAPNLLERAVAFGWKLTGLLDEAGDSLRLCHFRDPWSGVPILARSPRAYATVYEVNGLPSVELPYTYPHLAPGTLQKIAAHERFCLREADYVVTPSGVIRERLVAGGVPAGKIIIIPNGADPIDVPAARPADAPARYLIYFGALQAWQGLGTLLHAFARLADLTDLHLVICASHRSKRAQAYGRLAEKIGIAGRVLWRYALSEEELAPWRAHALLSIAPLTDCARNVEQGCAPLKILESMAAGVPVVASDLPAVRELMTDGEHGRLVHPERPGELARAIRVLLQYPDRLQAMGAQARRKIVREFTWARATQQLAELYRPHL